MIREEIYNNMKRKNVDLSKWACRDDEAIRFFSEEEDIRTPFYRDIDKIIYSLSYTRYMDKTQVFSFIDNDNISKRMTHVQMVSKIARTIGRALNLNEDLIEAAALGHDLGHVPFGHVGEKILNEISLNNQEGYFNHNIQSVRILMNLENNGKGSNVSLQVLDAIMCHNGELELKEYRPVKKDVQKFLKEYNDSYKEKEAILKMVPMTLEGCVVRISDIIAYLGRDIEDALRVGLITREDIPLKVSKVLGDNNSEIINTMVMNVIENSIDKDNCIVMSDDIFETIKVLKSFNYKMIYDRANSEESKEYYKEIFNKVFDYYLEQLKIDNKDSNIYKIYLKDMDKSYIDETSMVRKVIDYIAGMTDDFLVKEYELIKDCI